MSESEPADELKPLTREEMLAMSKKHHDSSREAEQTEYIDGVEVTRHDVDLKPGPLAPVSDPSPVSLLAQALAQGVNTEQLQQFMDMQQQHERNEARKAYAQDMVKCQSKMPQIMAQVEGEKTNSYYAKLGHINMLITPVYTKHGFSLSFGHGVAALEDEIRTTCRVLHKSGHCEDFFIDLPPDLAGAQGTVNKTAIHARASSNTYGQRYITKGIFNLSILSEDDDGALAGGQVVSNRVTEDEAERLGASILEWGLNSEGVLREFAISNWGQLPTKKLDKAKRRIQQLGEAMHARSRQ